MVPNRKGKEYRLHGTTATASHTSRAQMLKLCKENGKNRLRYRAGPTIIASDNLTQNPNMCTPYLRATSIKIKIFSSMTMRITENSTDLSSGPGPMSKSDEFSVIRIAISEIRRCEHNAFPINGYTYWDFESESVQSEHCHWPSQHGLSPPL